MHGPRSGLGYVWAAVGLAGMAVALVTLISLFRPGDNTAAIGAILGVVTPITGALIAFAVRDVHTLVNSRMTELLAAVGREQRGAGQLEGRAEGHAAAVEEAAAREG